jgi:hypothetical protein
MTELLKMLHDERTTLVRKWAGVDAAIHALNGSNVAATVIAAVTGVKAADPSHRGPAAYRLL